MLRYFPHNESNLVEDASFLDICREKRLRNRRAALLSNSISAFAHRRFEIVYDSFFDRFREYKVKVQWPP